jgi:hypothetical protein
VRPDQDFDAPALLFGILVSTVLAPLACRVRRGA